MGEGVRTAAVGRQAVGRWALGVGMARFRRYIHSGGTHAYGMEEASAMQCTSALVLLQHRRYALLGPWVSGCLAVGQNAMW